MSPEYRDPIELCDVSSVDLSACVNWCSCASVVIFSNSGETSSLSQFSLQFSVLGVLRSARCMSLLPAGVVE